MSTIKNLPLWVFHCNFNRENIAYSDKTKYYNENLCPILILDNETWDQFCYDKLLVGHQSTSSFDWNDYIKTVEEPQNTKTCKPSYILYFEKLYKQSRESDVIVVLEYSEAKYPRKVGKVKKGTEIVTRYGNGFRVYAFPLSDVKVIDKKYDQMFVGLYTHSVTAAPLNHHVSGVRNIYECKRPITPSLDDLSNSQIEELSCNWLSRLAEKDILISRVLVKSGKGNIPTIDILGCNYDKDIIAVQVSYTSNKDLIVDKIVKLLNFEADNWVICINCDDEKYIREHVNNKCKEINDYETKIDKLHIVQLQNIWNESIKDSWCKKEIDRMITDLYTF